MQRDFLGGSTWKKCHFGGLILVFVSLTFFTASSVAFAEAGDDGDEYPVEVLHDNEGEFLEDDGVGGGCWMRCVDEAGECRTRQGIFGTQGCYLVRCTTSCTAHSCVTTCYYRCSYSWGCPLN